MIGRIITIGESDPAGIAEAIAGKQDLLTFDSVPVRGSNNPVTSDGIASAIAEKQNALTFDSAPTAESRNPVTSGGVKAALDGKQDTLSFDGTPSAGSTKPVTSGGVYAALQEKQNRLYFDGEPTQGSNNILTSGAVYDAVREIEVPLEFDALPIENSSNLVRSGGVYAALTGKQDRIWRTSVTLTAEWSGNDPYSQVVSVPGTTANSMIELQPGIDAIRSFKQSGVDAMWVENDNGVLTVFALGAAPPVATEIQCVVTEVGNMSSASGESVILIDDELSPQSVNPVQNKAIYAALGEKETTQNRVTTITAASADTEYPTARAVWRLFSSLADGDGRSY